MHSHAEKDVPMNVLPLDLNFLVLMMSVEVVNNPYEDQKLAV